MLVPVSSAERKSSTRGLGARRLAVTHEQWAADRYALSPGSEPRFEMFVYVEDLAAMLARLTKAKVTVRRRRIVPIEMARGLPLEVGKPQRSNFALVAAWARGCRTSIPRWRFAVIGAQQPRRATPHPHRGSTTSRGSSAPARTRWKE